MEEENRSASRVSGLHDVSCPGTAAGSGATSCRPPRRSKRPCPPPDEASSCVRRECNQVASRNPAPARGRARARTVREAALGSQRRARPSSAGCGTAPGRTGPASRRRGVLPAGALPGGLALRLEGPRLAFPLADLVGPLRRWARAPAGLASSAGALAALRPARALERPMAMACFVERAPCFPGERARSPRGRTHRPPLLGLLPSSGPSSPSPPFSLGHVADTSPEEVGPSPGQQGSGDGTVQAGTCLPGVTSPAPLDVEDSQPASSTSRLRERAGFTSSTPGRCTAGSAPPAAARPRTRPDRRTPAAPGLGEQGGTSLHGSFVRSVTVLSPWSPVKNFSVAKGSVISTASGRVVA